MTSTRQGDETQFSRAIHEGILMDQTILPDKRAEFGNLFAAFFKSYPMSEEGQRHTKLYLQGRESGRKHFEALVTKTARDGDVTDEVLLHLLPHANNSGNRDKQAWIHVAPAVTKDLKSWFEGAGWTSPKDWPSISSAILSFVQRCVDDPDQLADACAAFAELPYSKGFQSGMLSPILNAIRPAEYLLINNKSRKVLNYFCGADFRYSLEDYPAANELAKKLVADVKEEIDDHKSDSELPVSDYFDMFSHWLVGVQKYAFTRPKYWKVSPGRDAKNWDSCRDGNFIAMGWSELGDLSGLGRSDYEQRRDKLVAENSDWTKQGANQAWVFSRIKEGDQIVANRGTHEVLGFGTVSGPYYYVEGEEHAHRIPVNWDDISARGIEENGWRKTIIKLDHDKFETLLKAPPKGEGPQVPPEHMNPIYSLTMLTEETGLDEPLLQRWINALERKGQAIIYGPPGTGKTFIAEHMVKHIIGGGDGFSEIVQFHPAYAYEDFMQGIRPQTTKDGQLRYPVVPGRFLDFCERATKRQGRCVLIVDEINRANLSRVFGELMYLLEYRNRAVPLAGGGELNVPQNVRLIGTMNTADRSIALVDHALRRRFAFLALYPDYDILTAYHEGTGINIEGLANMLKKLNKVIADRHYEVGITYFLREDLDEQIEDIWQMEIEPYLDEYFFDQPDKAKQFRWEAVKELIAL